MAGGVEAVVELEIAAFAPPGLSWALRIGSWGLRPRLHAFAPPGLALIELRHTRSLQFRACLCPEFKFCEGGSAHWRSQP